MKPALSLFIEIIKKKGVLEENGTVYDFLNLKISDQKKILTDYLIKSQIPKLIHNLFSYGLANEFLNIAEYSSDNKYKTYALRHRELCLKILQPRIKQYVYNLLIWDIKRRDWSFDSNELKTTYINNRIKELEEEKAFDDAVFKRYLDLLFDYLLDLFEKNEEQTFEMMNSPELDGFVTENNYFQLINLFRSKDAEIPEEGLQFLKSMAKSALESLIAGQPDFRDRYEYFFSAFIEALHSYKIFLSSLVFENSNNLVILNSINQCFKNEDIDGLIKILRSIFANVSNVNIKNTTEAYYHIFCHLVFVLAGFRVESEAQTNLGRIDCTIELDEVLYILEFKLSSSEKAIEQIRDTKYFERYLIKNKKIILVGLSFDKKEMNINEVYHKEIYSS